MNVIENPTVKVEALEMDQLAGQSRDDVREQFALHVFADNAIMEFPVLRDIRERHGDDRAAEWLKVEGFAGIARRFSSHQSKAEKAFTRVKREYHTLQAAA